ncbi:MAG: UUP1 family membrane protein [Proteobacteria bacterium]|nr:UUP1 family membrane protein [Pseudomonadota bacterium]
MSKYRQWIVLSLLLLLLGGLIFTYKVVRLGFPVTPDLTSKAWTIQVRLEIQPEDGPVRAELKLPSRSSGFTLSRENFISRGFGLTLDEETFSRQAHWAVRELREPRTLYYRATVIPETRQQRFAARPGNPQAPQLEEPFATALADIVAKVREESADTESFTASILFRLRGAGSDENFKLFLSEIEEPRELVRLA